jgi:hypothetical protein
MVLVTKHVETPQDQQRGHLDARLLAWPDFL